MAKCETVGCKNIAVDGCAFCSECHEAEELDDELAKEEDEYDEQD